MLLAVRVIAGCIVLQADSYARVDAAAVIVAVPTAAATVAAAAATLML
jgi:hypothetical protein